MVENYTVISDMIDRMFKTLYFAMNMYFEHIFNSPSTINRIMTYYVVGFNEDEPNKGFIMFNGKVVKEYKLVMWND